MLINTEHLIRQAAHEIGIQKPQVIASPEEPDSLIVRFKNRRGDEVSVDIPIAVGFKPIHAALKEAWKGKKKET